MEAEEPFVQFEHVEPFLIVAAVDPEGETVEPPVGPEVAAGAVFQQQVRIIPPDTLEDPVKRLNIAGTEALSSFRQRNRAAGMGEETVHIQLEVVEFIFTDERVQSPIEVLFHLWKREIEQHSAGGGVVELVIWRKLVGVLHEPLPVVAED